MLASRPWNFIDGNCLIRRELRGARVEGGDHIPTIRVLERILAVLDEELLIGIERQVLDEDPEREVAPVPKLAAA